MSFDDDDRPSEGSSNKTCLIVALATGGVGGVVLLCGGCCVGLIFFGMGQIEKEVHASLTDNPVIQQHIGDIQTFEMDVAASINHANEDGYIFQVTGSKGSGTIEAICLPNMADVHEAVSGELILDNGEVYDLFPEGVLFDEPESPDPGDDELAAGYQEFARQVRVDLEGHPLIAEHIGQIAEIRYDLARSLDEPGIHVYVFDLQGSKANARLRAECITIDEDTEDVVSGELILKNGTRVQLFPKNPLQ